MNTATALTTIRPELLSLLPAQFEAITPFLWIFGGSVVALLACVLRIVSPKWPVFLITVATAVAGIAATVGILHADPILIFNNMMAVDPYTNFFNFIFLGSAILTIFASMRYLDNEGLQHPEYYVLILFSALGMMLMAS